MPYISFSMYGLRPGVAVFNLQYVGKELQAVFAADLKRLIAEGVALNCTWVATSAPEPDAGVAVPSKPVDASDVNDPVWIAGQHGFVVGQHYQEKKKGLQPGTGVFKLVKFVATGAQFKEHAIWTEAHTVTTKFDDLAQDWSRFKGVLSEALGDISKHFGIEGQPLVEKVASSVVAHQRMSLDISM